jgi:hypothetical protein
LIPHNDLSWTSSMHMANHGISHPNFSLTNCVSQTLRIKLSPCTYSSV